METTYSMNPTTITVLGAGYVGLTTAALLAHAGYKVFVVEPNQDRLKVIKSGKSFFYEEGLDDVIRLAINSNNLIPTDSYEESVPLSKFIFSCVGTPDNPDGSSNLSYVFAAAKQSATLAQTDAVYIQKSTVPVGTGRKVEAIFNDTNAKINYISNPEFLREGTALSDTLFFDRVVVGGDDKQAVDDVMKVYMELENFRDHIAHIAKIPVGPRGDQYIATTLNSAELIKVTSNAFLALKISFANSIAKLADKADADVVEVMNAVGADTRIGRAFLNAGRGYGGGCFLYCTNPMPDTDILHACARSVNGVVLIDRIKKIYPIHFRNHVACRVIEYLWPFGCDYGKRRSCNRLFHGLDRFYGRREIFSCFNIRLGIVSGHDCSSLAQ